MRLGLSMDGRMLKKEIHQNQTFSCIFGNGPPFLSIRSKRILSDEYLLLLDSHTANFSWNSFVVNFDSKGFFYSERILFLEIISKIEQIILFDIFPHVCLKSSEKRHLFLSSVNWQFSIFFSIFFAHPVVLCIPSTFIHVRKTSHKKTFI
jgi:hypothetical protein